LPRSNGPRSKAATANANGNDTRDAPLRARLIEGGIRRLGSPRRGFRYRRADGRPAGRADLERIRSLVIPPGWRDVHVAASPRARVQAIGRDVAGRWQYLYHAAFVERRAREKYDRLAAFGRALPRLRRVLRRDLRRPGLPLEKAQATSVLLLASCALRPGASEYARDNGTFGLATLRSRHVTIEGSRVRLRFRGKRGVLQDHEVRSRTLARLLRTMKKLPGAEVLKFRDGEGRVRDLTRWHVNTYVKRCMGRSFSARDFRTWSATLLCANALRLAEREQAREARVAHGRDRRRGRADTPAARAERAIVAALDATASHLGNTRAVVRRSYVHPVVLDAYRAGRVVPRGFDRLDAHADRASARLAGCERALLSLLRPRRARGSPHRGSGRRGARTAHHH
jgi:DNA topoisomerase-1